MYNLSNAGLSNAHEEEEAVDLSQITYEREETEKSRDNKQAIKEALWVVNCSKKEGVP